MNLIWNKGGASINKSNLFLASIALTAFIFAMVLNVTNINIPSNYIFGLSTFTLILTLGDFAQMKSIKNWMTFFALPISFSLVLFITYRGYDENELNRSINTITVLSLALILGTIFFNDWRESLKRKE